jgi:hypothetical protein
VIPGASPIPKDIGHPIALHSLKVKPIVESRKIAPYSSWLIDLPAFAAFFVALSECVGYWNVSALKSGRSHE